MSSPLLDAVVFMLTLLQVTWTGTSFAACLQSSTTCASPRPTFSTRAITSSSSLKCRACRNTRSQWSVRGHQTLAIRAASGDPNYQRDIRLTDPVEMPGLFATGILELRLWKRGMR